MLLRLPKTPWTCSTIGLEIVQLRIVGSCIDLPSHTFTRLPHLALRQESRNNLLQGFRELRILFKSLFEVRHGFSSMVLHASNDTEALMNRRIMGERCGHFLKNCERSLCIPRKKMRITKHSQSRHILSIGLYCRLSFLNGEV